MKGYITTGGVAYNLENIEPAKENCMAVKKLMALGAVPFCHTNVPHAMYSHQTGNPIYGETSNHPDLLFYRILDAQYLLLANPYDPKRDCGGSTGGEGALVGSGGSIIGCGNDTAGSLVCPAALCGAW